MAALSEHRGGGRAGSATLSLSRSPVCLGSRRTVSLTHGRVAAATVGKGRSKRPSHLFPSRITIVSTMTIVVSLSHGCHGSAIKGRQQSRCPGLLVGLNGRPAVLAKATSKSYCPLWLTAVLRGRCQIATAIQVLCLSLVCSAPFRYCWSSALPILLLRGLPGLTAPTQRCNCREF